MQSKMFSWTKPQKITCFSYFVNDYIDVGLGEGGVGSSGLGVVSGNGGIGSNLRWRGVSSSWSSCTMGTTTCPIGLQPKFQLIYNKTILQEVIGENYAQHWITIGYV